MTRVIHGGNVWEQDRPAEWQDHSANLRAQGAPDWVLEAIRTAIEGVSYYPAPDMHRARAGLSQYLNLPPAFVQPASGGASAIELATRCGKRHAILCSPCFGEYRASAEKHGLAVQSVCLLDGSRGVLSPAKALGGRLQSDALIWLCNPMNPTGHAFSRREIEDLLLLAREANCRVALDEAFVDFCPGASCRELVFDWPELIVVGSLTKILGVPGVRLGYLCAQDALDLGENCLPWELNCFAEEIAWQLPQHQEELREEAHQSREETQRFSKELEALGLFVYPSEANFVLVDLGQEAQPIAEALQKQRILVRTCMDFEGIDDGKHLRLAVKDEQANAVFLKALKETLTCAENR